jgi:maltodextrin utilization protein YvdJ
MMRYDRVLRLALVPSIIFFLLSLVSVALTAHYWIIGDWIVPRFVKVTTNEFNDRIQQYVTDDTIVYFTETDTDVTIASGCLNLTAAIVALIAWSTLRKPGIDSHDAAVRTTSQRSRI